MLCTRFCTDSDIQTLKHFLGVTDKKIITNSTRRLISTTKYCDKNNMNSNKGKNDKSEELANQTFIKLNPVIIKGFSSDDINVETRNCQNLIPMKYFDIL